MKYKTPDERANKGACIYGTVIDDDVRLLTIYNDGTIRWEVRSRGGKEKREASKHARF